MQKVSPGSVHITHGAPEALVIWMWLGVGVGRNVVLQLQWYRMFSFVRLDGT
jgi:hypothetical protein